MAPGVQARVEAVNRGESGYAPAMVRQWTLEAAEAMLDEVRRRTEAALAAVDAVEGRVDAARPEERSALAAETRSHVSRWMREMEALGVEIHGPWRVEFRCQEGAFCWAWPEAPP